MLHVLTDNWDIFGRAFATTIKLFVVGAIGSLILGVLLGAFRVSPVPVLRGVAGTYVNIMQNTPLTLVFAFMAFAVPKLEVDLDYLTGAYVALIVYTAAFICEVVRSGINTVPAGQAEAARAVGMTFPQVLRIVVLPQAMRSMVAPTMSMLIALLKNTTVAAGFSVLESGAIPAYMSERGEPQLPVLVWITIGFLLIIVPLVLLQRYLERRWSVAR